MSNIEKQAVKLDPFYTDKHKEQLRNSVSVYGEFKFEDDSWYYSNRHKDGRKQSIYTVHFGKVPNEYKELVKYYALSVNTSVTKIQSDVYAIGFFLNYLKEYYPLRSLKEVDRALMLNFEDFVKQEKTQSRRAPVYAAVHKFFKVMSEFPEMPDHIPTKYSNPFKQKPTKKSEKYIPEEVIKKWDLIMFDETNGIPLEIRAVYWLLRSFPNRITEVLSLRQDCLKMMYSNYLLSFPTFKQNGGYDREEPKIIPISYNRHGKYVIDLIKRVQTQTEEYLKTKTVRYERETGYLFLATAYTIKPVANGVVARPAGFSKDAVTLMSRPKIARVFEQLAESFNITDSKGSLYAPTTHQFRHNNVTDRYYLGGYTMEQLTKLTGHKNLAMFQHYLHSEKQSYKEALQELNPLNPPDKSGVEFQGKIFNLDEKTIRALKVKNPQAYITGEAMGKRGVGICSNLDGCNPDGTPALFECYACNWFVPRAENLDLYKEELEHWTRVYERTKDDPKRQAHKENALRNATLTERIVKICENGLGKYQAEMDEKLRDMIRQSGEAN